ncbi:hypothetical protein [Nonomuraea sp. NEAU-A123]|uniref:hypothetical protein n=1 Tax=Nonomuraea sp. NEAU-A123 TaxID=2839649 RepID=UPI001BE437AD|nr:hypothetical protein [Nonomuraea sp. NEAU-A123]MBT2232522.1 hypothetical protein [Nonomuraea sp. NEAU-A123]
MGRPRNLLALAVIFLASARAAQRRKSTQPTDQAAHRPGSTSATQTAPTGSTDATGRVVSLWTMIGTVLAGVAALAALVVSVMTFILQQQQNDDQRQRRLAGFASKVTWWTEHTAQDQVILAIQNSGYEPMPASVGLSSSLVFTDPGTNLMLLMRRSSFPSSMSVSGATSSMSSVMDIGALPPCSISRLRLTFRDKGAGPGVVPAVDYVTVVDPAGMAWSRMPSGLLVRGEVTPRDSFETILSFETMLRSAGIRIKANERSVTLTNELERTTAPSCSGSAD